MIEQIFSYIVAPIVAAFLAWFFTRRKNNAEIETVTQSAKSQELENIESAIGIWRKMAEELIEDMKELKAQNNALEEQNNSLGQQMRELSEKLTTLEKDHRELMDAHESLKKKYT